MRDAAEAGAQPAGEEGADAAVAEDAAESGDRGECDRGHDDPGAEDAERVGQHGGGGAGAEGGEQLSASGAQRGGAIIRGKARLEVAVAKVVFFFE